MVRGASFLTAGVGFIRSVPSPPQRGRPTGLDGTSPARRYWQATRPEMMQRDGSSTAYWPGWDIARGATAWTGAPSGNPGGWVLDGWGGLHQFGSAQPATWSAYWPGWDIARAVAGSAGASASRTPPPPPVKRKILISLSQQHLYAYENGKLLLDTDVATGRPQLPTPPGDYQIFY